MRTPRRKHNYTFNFIRFKSPQIIQHMLLDLLERTNCDEADIGFCAGIDLDKLRAIPQGRLESLTRKDIESLFSLYASVFCRARIENLNS